MIAQKQLHRHDPENGSYGDCWRTCIACLLDLPPEGVPHFAVGNTDRDEWYDRTQFWLGERGLRLVAIPFLGRETLEAVLDSVSHHNPGTPFIITGRKGNFADHNVICRDGKVIWDPSLEPIEGGVTDAATGGYWWVYFIGMAL